MSHEHPFTVNWIVVRFVNLHLYFFAVFKLSEISRTKQAPEPQVERGQSYVINEGSTGQQCRLLVTPGQIQQLGEAL